MVMRRSRLPARTLVMGLELKIRVPTSAAPLMDIVGGDADRRRRVLAMAASLIEMFGKAALSVALGQPGTRDVSGKSGIHWSEIVQALRDQCVSANR